MNWFLNLFRKKKPAVVTPPVVTTPPVVVAAPTFVDNFTNLDNWRISTWDAPGKNSTHIGRWVASHVSTNTGLCLKLSQAVADGMFVSHGAEIVSKQSFGYGRYEFVVRASSTAFDQWAVGSPVSGSITGVFNYGPSSITEIDFEVEGGSRSSLSQFTSWKGETNLNQTTAVQPIPNQLPHQGFHKYAWVWSPGKIEFYRDDVLVATHTKVVPSEACPVILNHWGTNDVNWGGTATPGVDRYMFVKSFKFTPL